MKAGWLKKKLSELCSIKHGFAFNGDDFSNLIPDSYPLVITPGNFTEDGKLLFNEKNSKRFKGKIPVDFLFEIGDLVTVMTDLSSTMKILGKPAVIETDGVLHNQRIGRVIFFDDSIEKRFVYYFMMSDYFLENIRKSATGTMVRHTAPTRILSNIICYPQDKSEQKRLVTLIDEAFESIATAKANAQQNLKNARALFESYLNEVFTKRGEGWEEKSLEQIGTTQTGSTPKTTNPENFGDFISFVKPSDFNKNGSIDYEKEGLSEIGFTQSRKISKNSVLMVCIGATIGKCGYVEREVTTNQQINAITPIHGVSYKFIYYQMLTDNFQRRVILNSGQATLPIINKSKWSALTISIPKTLVEQEQIVSKLDALSEETQRLEALYSRKIAALDELKKALLHRAFSGEL